MSSLSNKSFQNFVDTVEVPASAREFVTYCEIEYQHRTSSGNEFDEPLFNNAIDLVLRKLRYLEKRGCV